MAKYGQNVDFLGSIMADTYVPLPFRGEKCMPNYLRTNLKTKKNIKNIEHDTHFVICSEPLWVPHISMGN